MKKYRGLYEDVLNNFESAKHDIIVNLAHDIKHIASKPIHIGNHWFYVVKENGEDVPAYCHQKYYNPNSPKFKPIYDSKNSGEFGWSDFGECCRIFDSIDGRLKGLAIMTFLP